VYAYDFIFMDELDQIMEIVKQSFDHMQNNDFGMLKEASYLKNEYSRAVTPQIRQAGNRLSGLAETAYASLLA